MFQDLIEFPISSKKLSWEAKQVVKDMTKAPHLFQRFTLRGTLFPQRALKPFVRVGERVANITEISEDGLTVNAYFDHPVPENQSVEFGYGDQVFLLFPERTNVRRYKRLDMERISKEVRNYRNFIA